MRTFSLDVSYFMLLPRAPLGHSISPVPLRHPPAQQGSQHPFSEGREHPGATKHSGSSYLFTHQSFLKWWQHSLLPLQKHRSQMNKLIIFTKCEVHAIFSGHGQVTPRLCHHTTVTTTAEFAEMGHSKPFATALKSTQAAKSTQETGQVLRELPSSTCLCSAPSAPPWL